MALALTRTEDETIVIGDNIVVTVVRVNGKRVRLAIEAPREIPIRRGELLEDSPSKVADSAEDGGTPL